uniref:MULE transposase domain-containing protein n=1 Tax=Lactuca sativa TaxID=4236 RepID=A0A9R1XBJ4_LACSA|nr:hypothetical protein LSAT_V11C500237170 [Lactuca sativa]
MKKHVFGNLQKQYAVLKDYGLELMERNPGINVKIDCHTEPNINSDTRMFRRIYICLGALKEGFNANLRDFIGLDGTFMKGPYHGQILTVLGVDSNNGIYPLAYAITWFLEQLGDDLELYSNSNFSFILDRQKGIIYAMAKVDPQDEHRFYLRHIYYNMKRQWKDKELKDFTWACATVTTLIGQDLISKVSTSSFNDVYNYLSLLGMAHTNILLDTLCEVVNGKIQGGRDKLIIYYLEYIREYLMKRICNV